MGIGYMAYWRGAKYDPSTGDVEMIWRRGRVEDKDDTTITVRLSRFADINCPPQDDGKLYRLPNGRWTEQP